MFILSDTRDDQIARAEQQSIRALQAMLSPGIELYYRRRAENTDRKVGNIADWVCRWGGGYDAMLVLDADSLMTGSAITELTDALARAAQGIAARGFVTADGLATGDPAIRVGSRLALVGVNPMFENAYCVTSAIHRFDREDGYVTEFIAQCAYLGAGA